MQDPLPVAACDCRCSCAQCSAAQLGTNEARGHRSCIPERESAVHCVLGRSQAEDPWIQLPASWGHRCPHPRAGAYPRRLKSASRCHLSQQQTCCQACGSMDRMQQLAHVLGALTLGTSGGGLPTNWIPARCVELVLAVLCALPEYSDGPGYTLSQSRLHKLRCSREVVPPATDCETNSAARSHVSDSMPRAQPSIWQAQCQEFTPGLRGVYLRRMTGSQSWTCCAILVSRRV